jgi:hypothetical protein
MSTARKPPGGVQRLFMNSVGMLCGQSRGHQTDYAWILERHLRKCRWTRNSVQYISLSIADDDGCAWYSMAKLSHVQCLSYAVRYLQLDRHKVALAFTRRQSVIGCDLRGGRGEKQTTPSCSTARDARATVTNLVMCNKASFLVILSTTQSHDHPAVKSFRKRSRYFGMPLQVDLDERPYPKRPCTVLVIISRCGHIVVRRQTLGLSKI